MRGVVKFALGPGNMEYREVPSPVPGPGQVLIRVKAAGLCGTDLEIYHGDFPTVIPCVVGHEGAGEVIAVGQGVEMVSVGDRVAMETSYVICGHCYYCRVGNYNLCSERRGLGYGTNGTWAQLLITDATRVHRLAPNISYEQAAVLEPLSVATRAAHIAGIGIMDRVAIIGTGPIALFLLQVAKAAGARQVLMVGRRNRSRADLAESLGADRVHLLSDGVDPRKAIMEWTDGQGADVVFEASGSPESATAAISYARRAGTVVMVGLYPKATPVEWNDIVKTEKVVKGTWTSGVFTDWQRAVTLVAEGRVKLDPLITHRFPLDEWERGMKLLERGECVKVVLLPKP